MQNFPKAFNGIMHYLVRYQVHWTFVYYCVGFLFQQSEFDNFWKVRIRKVDQKQQDMFKKVKAPGFFFWYEKYSIV